MKPHELSQLVEAAPNKHTTTQVSNPNGGDPRGPTLLAIWLTGIVQKRIRIFQFALGDEPNITEASHIVSYLIRTHSHLLKI